MAQRQLPGLAEEERQLLQRLFSNPIDFPPEFKAWLKSHAEVNTPSLPLSEMLGYADMIKRIEALESALGL